jgi:hypothetical protein
MTTQSGDNLTKNTVTIGDTSGHGAPVLSPADTLPISATDATPFTALTRENANFDGPDECWLHPWHWLETGPCVLCEEMTSGLPEGWDGPF